MWRLKRDTWRACTVPEGSLPLRGVRAVRCHPRSSPSPLPTCPRYPGYSSRSCQLLWLKANKACTVWGEHRQFCWTYKVTFLNPKCLLQSFQCLYWTIATDLSAFWARSLTQAGIYNQYDRWTFSRHHVFPGLIKVLRANSTNYQCHSWY